MFCNTPPKVNNRLFFDISTAIGSMAYDWINENWYFVDVSNNRIILCNSEGQKCVRIINFGSLVPQTLVLEPNLG